MVSAGFPWGRWFLFALVATMGLSSGVATVATGGLEGLTGHTAFIRGVHFRDLPDAPALPPLEYGLATYREVRLFGLWSVDRPVQETQDRMVFVWSADAPDPRGEKTLAPTGDYARLRDRHGISWTVYEFTYLDGARLHHAYGVRVGPLHQSDDHTLGRDGTYNYVLTYRPDRLLQPQAVPQATADAATSAAKEGLPVPDPLGAEPFRVPPEMRPPEEPKEQIPRVAFGTGTVPPALEAADPATERQAPPSPPGIPSLPER